MAGSRLQAFDEIELTQPVPSEFGPDVYPAGTRGVVVGAYADPERDAVDVRIHDADLVGGFRYDNVVLSPDQLRVVEPSERSHPMLRIDCPACGRVLDVALPREQGQSHAACPSCGTEVACEARWRAVARG